MSMEPGGVLNTDPRGDSGKRVTPQVADGGVQVLLPEIHIREVIIVWLWRILQSEPLAKLGGLENTAACIQAYKKQEGETKLASKQKNLRMGNLYRKQAAAISAASIIQVSKACWWTK